MIVIRKLNKAEPYNLFKLFLDKAKKNSQKPINAVCISSYDLKKKEVSSRFVNLKYIQNDEWLFFSNYNSPKASEFEDHSQISALIFWEKINIQIRMKAHIEKASNEFSDEHFRQRSIEKNVLSIASNQSQKIESYEKVIENYENKFPKINVDLKRPEYWGGYSFKPFYFEFWEGHKNRLNKRVAFEKNRKIWKKYYLEP